jgi:two-component SAPR family response regulator
MLTEQYKNLTKAIHFQSKTAKDDYKAGRIDIKTFQYLAKRLESIQLQLTIEYEKTKNKQTSEN